MIRFRIGAFLLAALLAVSLWAQWMMGRNQAPVADALERAAQSAMEHNWIAAGMHLKEAQSRWQKHRHFTAAFSDHTPMEDIDSLLAQLTAYAGNDGETFAAICKELRCRVEAVADAHRLTWWNLF